MSDPSKRRKLSPASFDWVALAGRGAFGKVWVVRFKDDLSGKVMALKVINKKEAVDKDCVAHTLLEREIMTQVRPLDRGFFADLSVRSEATPSLWTFT
jgi:hypothetical protein